MTEIPKLDCWAVVELFGHQQIAGKVSEHAIGGASLLRVDVPELPGIPERTIERYGQNYKVATVPASPGFTKFFGASAIYSLTPCDEQTALRVAQSMRVVPIQAYTPAPSMRMLSEGEDDERD